VTGGEPRPGAEKRFHGIGVSPGIARGVVVVHRTEDELPPVREVSEADIPEEIARLEDALLATRGQILSLQERIAGSIGAKDASIFDAHLLVVEDRTLLDEVLRTLQRDRLNVEHIFSRVANRYAATLEQIDDPYLRERATDIHDVARRVIRNLTGKEARDLGAWKTEHLLVAHNLTPSDTAQLNRSSVLGFATDVGSKTSHTAIMARSLNIPAVVGLHNFSEQVDNGDDILLDGYNGVVILNPNEQTLWEYGELEIKKTEVEEQLHKLRETQSTTADGRHVILSANIELPDEVEQVNECGAEGVGLFRTEFFYLNRTGLPTEEDQFQAYRDVAQAVAPHSVIIRTLDLGGDKLMTALNLPEEENPFLGCRAIRFCLERPDVFKTQIRAILRASACGNVRMMYPMISGVEELRRANAVLEECRRELVAEGQPFNAEMEVGAMIEIPSAAVCADLLAREVDFFSIGTNDLIQYTIAVDRLNEKISHLYEPTHPAILRLIRTVVDAGHAEGIWVGVCGEMAGDVVLAPLLLGLGVDELSAGAAVVPRVKRAVQSLDMKSCLELVESVIREESPARIQARCEELARRLYPDLL
jgi:phosphotransferase system enzyme I (PtsI)